MADQLVLVNGLPGSGKTKLAVELADNLRGTLLSKDQIKEALAVVLSGAVPATIGVVAMQTLWALARELDETVIVESFWFRPRDLDFARDGIRRSMASRAVEIWCDVPTSTARTRYSSRRRGALHDDARRLTTDWAQWADHAAPLAITPVIRVDTTRPVLIAEVSRRVRQQFDTPE